MSMLVHSRGGVGQNLVHAVVEWPLMSALLPFWHSFILLQRRPNKQTGLHNNQTNCALLSCQNETWLLHCRKTKHMYKQPDYMMGKTTAVHYQNVRRESRHVAEMRPDFCTANVSVIVNCRDGKTTELSAVLVTIERCRKTFYPQGNLKRLVMISRARWFGFCLKNW